MDIRLDLQYKPHINWMQLDVLSLQIIATACEGLLQSAYDLRKSILAVGNIA
jgi:hypothetical protein